MDKADKFVNNKQPRRIAAAYLIIFILSLTAAWIVSGIIADRIVSEHIREMLSALGGGRFTGVPDPSAVLNGETLYSGYGISSDMTPRLMDGYGAVRRQIFLGLVSVSGIICITGMVVSIRQLFGIYNKLEILREDCLKISERLCRRSDLADDDLGCVSRLADGINCIAGRMEHLTGSLRSEKNFLKDFLTDFSHQLKTSLAVVRLNSDVLLEMNGLPEQRRESLADEISENLERMNRLITAAIKLAKVNADAVEYTMQEGDLSELCREAVRKISPLLRRKNIEIRVNTADSVIFPHDPVWLCEAVENIIKNCADHSECTEIVVEAYEDPMSAVIVVSDNGKGIPQEDIPYIFERFGKKSGNISMSSAGIGMSVSQKIVQAHGGEILVYSEPGKGTRFENIFLK